MATLRCLNYKKKFSGRFGKKYLLILTEKHEKKGAMEITERWQIGLDLVK